MVTKVTTVVVVDAIEPVLPHWEALGFAAVATVPHGETVGFAILAREGCELMFQTRASVREDLGIEPPAFVLYCEVESLAAAAAAIPGAEVLIDERITPYGATERWVRDPAGNVVGLAVHG
jgi:hypothetical protein